MKRGLTITMVINHVSKSWDDPPSRRDFPPDSSKSTLTSGDFRDFPGFTKRLTPKKSVILLVFSSRLKPMGFICCDFVFFPHFCLISVAFRCFFMKFQKVTSIICDMKKTWPSPPNRGSSCFRQESLDSLMHQCWATQFFFEVHLVAFSDVVRVSLCDPYSFDTGQQARGRGKRKMWWWGRYDHDAEARGNFDENVITLWDFCR